MDNRKDLMADIYHSTGRPVARLSRAPQPLPPEPPRQRKKIIAIVIAIPLLATILFYGTRGLVVKKLAAHSAELIEERIAQAKQALIAFDVHKAHDAFLDIKRIVIDLESEASRYGLLGLAEIAGTFSSQLAAAPQALSIMHRLSDSVLSIIETSEHIKANAFDLMVNRQGKTLITHLTSLQEKVASLGEILEEMKENASSLDYPVGDDVLAFRAQLYRTEQLLGAAIDWLSDTNHVAVMFMNPSEIRPGGGFPGSYAGITVSRGNVEKIEVKDIYDPDGQLDIAITPPRQLQLITSTWGARDANWFFDFPTSARKILYFLNESKIYREQDLTFSALLAIHVNAVSDILSVTGPIDLPEYHLTLTDKNFLHEVQREVRSGLDRTVGEPKRILKILTPLLLERISLLNAAQKGELIKLIRQRFATKDMLVYIEDAVMQTYLEELAVAGEVHRARDGTLNEYLAVVNANIGGGKTDAVMRQSITLKSRIDLEGKINNTLTIRRTHNGKSSADTWYQTTNKNFLQIFTPRGSNAVFARGADPLPTIPQPGNTDHKTDRDVAAIENSVEHLGEFNLNQTLAFNKTVFAGWFNTAPGATKTFELQYINPQKINYGGTTDYVFVFEKQPGIETALSITIDAPPEYKWKEENSATYAYETSSAPGRLVVPLTLVPIR